jgi:hypothetical protein
LRKAAHNTNATEKAKATGNRQMQKREIKTRKTGNVRGQDTKNARLALLLF